MMNFNTDMVQDYAYWPDLFTAEECDRMLEIGRSLVKEDGVYGDDAKQNESVRKSKIAWVPNGKDTVIYYQKISQAVIDMNSQFFKFDLSGFFEQLQFTEYTAPGGKYGLHMDRSYAITTRKLSIVLQLTDPSEYEGGELQLLVSGDTLALPKERGTLLIFPSFVMHQVTPVTKGMRNSLVGWVAGPSFK